MDDFSDKISSLLSDPESMGKILNAVKAINGASSQNDKVNDDTEMPEEIFEKSEIGSTEATAEERMGSIKSEDKKSSLGTILSSPELERLFGNGNKERCALLNSMRPFLQSSKRERIDEIVKTLKLIDMFYGAKEFF